MLKEHLILPMSRENIYILIAFFFFKSVSITKLILVVDTILIVPIFICSADNAISDPIAQGFVPCGLKIEPEVGVLGQKWAWLCSPWLVGRAGSGRDKQSSWLRAHCPLVRHASFPGRTGNLLALVMNQKKWKDCSKHS